MCITNVSSLCKWFVVFLGIVIGVAVPLVFNALGITVTARIPFILLALSALLVLTSVILSVYSTSRNDDFAACYCTVGPLLAVASVISTLLSFVGVAIVSAAAVILPVLGVTIAFFSIGLLSLVCFALCLNRQNCCSCTVN